MEIDTCSPALLFSVLPIILYIHTHTHTHISKEVMPLGLTMLLIRVIG